jgi:hypothetical protein
VSVYVAVKINDQKQEINTFSTSFIESIIRKVFASHAAKNNLQVAVDVGEEHVKVFFFIFCSFAVESFSQRFYMN